MWIGSSSAGRRLTAAFLLAVFGASGCGTLKLYDQSKETAAEEIKMKVVEAMKALGRGQLVIPRPTPDQVEAVQRLAREVDGLTRASVTAGDTIVAAGQALAAVQKMQLS